MKIGECKNRDLISEFPLMLHYDEFIKLGDKKNKNDLVIFNEYTGGLKTSRDSWNYNFSLNKRRTITVMFPNKFNELF